jgi:predicted DNA-binding transcriptional regulator AlpA
MTNSPALKQAQNPDVDTPTLGVGQPELATVQQAAAFLGCSVASVWRDVDKGRIRPPIKIGGRTRFVMPELVASIKAKMAARSK